MAMIAGQCLSLQPLIFFAEIMNYDVYYDIFSKVVGPNSLLDDSCAAAADQTGSATSAVKLWIAAGFSAKQIVLGVPSYGHGYSISQTAAVQGNTLASYPSVNTNNPVTGDSWDAKSLRWRHHAFGI
ncbi:glycoside hydrolase family 18 protein [Suillus brevipes Sb2]|nr:glycoside hydrolase family 18 protein [Suillus brevipes Sb2]